MKVLFAGGGTGGHIYMAVALAESLKERDPSSRFLFVGTPRGLEEHILTPLGYSWTTIEIGGLNRVGLGKSLRSLMQLPAAMRRSRRILRDFDPDLVVGLGGYSSGPVGWAAHRLRIPLLLIEPNVLPGMTNRILGRWADASAVAFEETQLGTRCHLTGVPVRQPFFHIETSVADNGRLRLLVFGGSQGSRPINRIVTEALPYLDSERFSILHQTGPKDHLKVQDDYCKAGSAARIVPFISDMPEAFSKADLIVSRAGASSVAEIAAAGRPSVLIPFPQAADNHQFRNAQALAKKAAALALPQEGLSGSDLAAHLNRLEKDRERLRKMGRAARSLARPDSVESILALMKNLVEEATS